MTRCNPAEQTTNTALLYNQIIFYYPNIFTFLPCQLCMAEGEITVFVINNIYIYQCIPTFLLMWYEAGSHRLVSHRREYACHWMFVCSLAMTICQYIQIWIPSDTYMIASDKHVYILDIYKWF